jgi:DNA-binding HxlR family transcriptional regulator
MQLEKLTKPRQGKEKPWYDDACGLAHALDLVGERWALLVLRELMFGPRRFSEMKADLPGISANVLAQRLAELEARGLVRKTRLPPPASVQVYEATQWGLEAAPVIGSLGKWAARSPQHDPTLPISHVSVMMSLQTMVDPALAQGINARLGFRFGEASYAAILNGGRLDVERGEVGSCDVLFTARPAELAAVVYGGAPLETIDVKGDMELAKRFTTLFPLPPKAE